MALLRDLSLEGVDVCLIRLEGGLIGVDVFGAGLEVEASMHGLLATGNGVFLGRPLGLGKMAGLRVVVLEF